MTSKEALERLEVYCTDYDSLEQPFLDCEDELNIIKKDLEVLEILKKNEVDIFYISAVNNGDYKDYPWGNLTEKEFNLITEWLENDN